MFDEEESGKVSELAKLIESIENTDYQQQRPAALASSTKKYSLKKTPSAAVRPGSNNVRLECDYFCLHYRRFLNPYTLVISIQENLTSGPKSTSEESSSGYQTERSSAGISSRADRQKKNEVIDTLDHTVLRFNADCCLRTNASRYLSVLPEIEAADESQKLATSKISKTHQVNSKLFLLSGEGQGNGDAADCFQFASLENK